MRHVGAARAAAIVQERRRDVAVGFWAISRAPSSVHSTRAWTPARLRSCLIQPCAGAGSPFGPFSSVACSRSGRRSNPAAAKAATTASGASLANARPSRPTMRPAGSSMISPGAPPSALSATAQAPRSVAFAPCMGHNGHCDAVE